MRVFGPRALATSMTMAVALVLGAGAAAGTYTAAPLTNVSGLSPFGAFASCDAGPLDAPLYVNSEVEPWIAVNPANTSNAIAVFQAACFYRHVVNKRSVQAIQVLDNKLFRSLNFNNGVTT
jgi:hypothetical protein